MLQPIRGPSPPGRQSRQRVKVDQLSFAPTPPPTRSSGPSRPTNTELVAAAPIVSIATLPGCRTRELFSDFVAEFSRLRDNFQSDTLFCEALMTKASALDAKEQCDGVLVAAASAWALNIMAENPQNALMTRLRDALLPALFVGYDKAAPCDGVATYDQMRIDRTHQEANPYLSHQLYWTEYNEAKGVEDAFADSRNKMMSLMMEKQRGTKHILRKWQNTLVKSTFRAWKNHTRGVRIDRFAREQRRRLFLRESRGFILQSAFSSWRLLVETARCHSLEEKVHSSTYQLENAKNQFQLQCYRSDKYLRTVEELRAEMKELREEREGFRDEVRDLERKLRKIKEESRLDLNFHVNNLLHVINEWRQFSRASIDQLKASSSVLDLMDDQANASIQQTKRLSSSYNADSEYDEEEESLEEIPEVGGGDAQQAARQMNDEMRAEKVLLRWCNQICNESIVSQVEEVKNFTDDFQNGEVLLFLMHHVFPANVPFSPLQETNLPKRLDLITAIGKELGIANLPRSSDLMEGTGDYNVMVTAELFNRFMARARGEAIRAERTEEADGTTKIRFDVDMVDTVLKEADQEMRALKATQTTISSQELAILELGESVTRHAGYLTRERLYGNPVQVMDKKEVSRYCRFSKNRFRDISFKYKNAPLDYSEKWLPFDDQLGELKKMLKRHFHTVRRVFKFYAGSNPTMSDNDFWRFCGDIRVLDKNFSRVTVDRIFTIANMDDVPIEGEEKETDDEEQGDDEEENPATELIASEFVECIVRMADAKIPSKMIHERCDAFISNFVSPFACKSEMDKFKKDIYAASTQSAVQRYLKDFNRLFQHFSKFSSKKEKTEKKKGARQVMSIEAFTLMLDEANMRTGQSSPFDDAAIQSIFKAVHGDDSLSDATVNQFLEICVSCAVYKTANPFVGLDKKFDIFATGLISSLRAKLKGVVPLSDLKPITLQSLQR